MPDAQGIARATIARISGECFLPIWLRTASGVAILRKVQAGEKELVTGCDRLRFGGFGGRCGRRRLVRTKFGRLIGDDFAAVGVARFKPNIVLSKTGGKVKIEDDRRAGLRVQEL